MTGHPGAPPGHAGPGRSGTARPAGLAQALGSAAGPLLIGASVYREPADRNALLFQVGRHDWAAAWAPGRPGPAPPYPAPPDLAALIAGCAAKGLLAVCGPGADLGSVFVERPVAAELSRLLRVANRAGDLAVAHERAAAYWRWRTVCGPRERRADLHDLLEARHHLRQAGQTAQACELTEALCSLLHAWGELGREAALIGETLAWLPENSAQRAAWVRKLGTIAQVRADYAEAERCYQQALDIYAAADEPAGVSRCHHSLGVLAQAQGEYARAEARYQQSAAAASGTAPRAGAGGPSAPAATRPPAPSLPADEPAPRPAAGPPPSPPGAAANQAPRPPAEAPAPRPPAEAPAPQPPADTPAPQPPAEAAAPQPPADTPAPQPPADTPAPRPPADTASSPPRTADRPSPCPVSVPAPRAAPVGQAPPPPAADPAPRVPGDAAAPNAATAVPAPRPPGGVPGSPPPTEDVPGSPPTDAGPDLQSPAPANGAPDGEARLSVRGVGWRLAGPVGLAVAMLALSIAEVTGLSGPAGRAHLAAPGATAVQGVAAVRRQAADWVTAQISRSAIVACDPAMCSALQAHGFPAEDLLMLGPRSPSLLGSDVVVATAAVRSRFGARLAGANAPMVLASFGSGRAAIEVRAVAPDGVVAFRDALAADLVARRLAGTELLQNPGISAPGAAGRQLAEGAVDSRLLITLAALAGLRWAAQPPVRVISFGGPGPGASAQVPLCSMVITGPAAPSVIAFLRAQHPPYLAADIALVRPAGLPAAVRIGFSSPSPLGLLTTSFSATGPLPPP